MGLAAAAWATAAIAAIGTGASAYSSYQQGETQKQWAEYNAAISRQKAEQVNAAAKANAERQRIANAEQIGKARVAFNVSGATPAGSPTGFLADTAAKQELDVLTYLYNQQLQSDSLLQEAGISTIQGENAAAAGRVNAAQSLLSGVGKAASIYSSYRSDEALQKLAKK